MDLQGFELLKHEMILMILSAVFNLISSETKKKVDYFL